MTQTRKEALTDLLAKVESGYSLVLPDFKDALNTLPPLYRSKYNAANAWGAFSGNVEDALMLFKVVLPDWDATLSVGACSVELFQNVGSEPIRGWRPGPVVQAETLACALLIAIIKALIAQEPDQ